MTPYYTDDTVTLWHGDCLDVLRQMPDGSADAAVTSPPYFGLRDYGHEQQWGAEPTVQEFIDLSLRTRLAQPAMFTEEAS